MICSGIAVGADYADVVIVDAEPGKEAMTLVTSRRVQLQEGDRAQAFRALGDQVANILRESKVAEVRGLVLYVASGVSQVTSINPTVLSKTFGDRKPKEYLKDEGYWNDRNLKNLEKRYREPCLLIIANQESSNRLNGRGESLGLAQTLSSA